MQVPKGGYGYLSNKSYEEVEVQEEHFRLAGSRHPQNIVRQSGSATFQT